MCDFLNVGESWYRERFERSRITCIPRNNFSSPSSFMVNVKTIWSTSTVFLSECEDDIINEDKSSSFNTDVNFVCQHNDGIRLRKEKPATHTEWQVRQVRGKDGQPSDCYCRHHLPPGLLHRPPSGSQVQGGEGGWCLVKSQYSMRVASSCKSSHRDLRGKMRWQHLSGGSCAKVFHALTFGIWFRQLSFPLAEIGSDGSNGLVFNTL